VKKEARMNDDQRAKELRSAKGRGAGTERGGCSGAQTHKLVAGPGMP